jgi:hypothetical protein
MTTETPVGALAVRDLVRRRLGDAWDLALVQRDETWDQVRMRYLLDSLLAGYPIGSLLLCRVTEGTKVMRADGREVADAAAGAWQLLDGQQRINALFSLFTDKGGYGEFFLHMGVARPRAAGPVTRRRARDQGLGYIHWHDAAKASAEVPQRPSRICLNRWYSWAEELGEDALRAVAESLTNSSTDVIAILNKIDPDFADTAEGLDIGVARDRLAQLIRLWVTPAIPVEHCELTSPMDVLEVFTRLNRAGVQVAGQDLFFAAVKTVWPQAEKVVEATTRVLTDHGGGQKFDPLIDRMTAIRVIARLAARALSRADLVPLAIDRLTGERGRHLVRVMEELCDPAKPPLRRMAAVMTVLVLDERSSLGFGLYSVDARLWDPVLGWAAVHPRGEDDKWLVENLPRVEAFLLGATAFRWAVFLGDRFSRRAMTEALVAGTRGEAFPIERIAQVTHDGNADLRGGRGQVPRLDSEEAKVRWADANAPLLLSVLQGIRFQPQRDYFDWDHIYPQAKASLMWSPGPGGRWRQHHKYRRFIHSAGNLWGLHFGTNRSERDNMPAAKFQAIQRSDGAGPVWSRDRWWLTDVEIEAFGRVGARLERREVDLAMDEFHLTVVARATRMVDEVLERMPLVRWFENNGDSGSTDPSPEPSISEALGLEISEAEVGVPLFLDPGPNADKVATVLAQTDPHGSRDALRRLLERGQSAGLKVRGYKYSVNLTPPSTMSTCLVALKPRNVPVAGVEVWLDPGVFVDAFPDIPAKGFKQVLPDVRWVLHSPDELDRLADRIDEAFAHAPTK